MFMIYEPFQQVSYKVSPPALYKIQTSSSWNVYEGNYKIFCNNRIGVMVFRRNVKK